MCNLYRMANSATEVARLFDAVDATQGGNRGEEVYPGTPGLVVAGGEVRQMNWGLPLSLRGKQGQLLKPRPVNNARTDRLDTYFWRSSFEHRRCLIPVTAFAEAEGQKGAKTRTWFSVPDSEIFACAGVWRDSDEWGPSYAMVMTEANAEVREFHDRMPVIIPTDRRRLWLEAEPETARALCEPWSSQLAVERTSDRWNHTI